MIVLRFLNDAAVPSDQSCSLLAAVVENRQFTCATERCQIRRIGQTPNSKAPFDARKVLDGEWAEEGQNPMLLLVTKIQPWGLFFGQTTVTQFGQSSNSSVESATSPSCQFALSTCGLRMRCTVHPKFDGSECHDNSCQDRRCWRFRPDLLRNFRVRAFLTVEEGDQILPFVREICCQPLTHTWKDEMGIIHDRGCGVKRPFDAIPVPF